jgi:hypothetical protein
MRVNINDGPQAEQGGRRISTNLFFGGFSTPSVGIDRFIMHLGLNVIESVAPAVDQPREDHFEKPCKKSRRHFRATATGFNIDCL